MFNYAVLYYFAVHILNDAHIVFAYRRYAQPCVCTHSVQLYSCHYNLISAGAMPCIRK